MSSLKWDSSTEIIFLLIANLVTVSDKNDIP